MKSKINFKLSFYFSYKLNFAIMKIEKVTRKGGVYEKDRDM